MLCIFMKTSLEMIYLKEKEFLNIPLGIYEDELKNDKA